MVSIGFTFQYPNSIPILCHDSHNKKVAWLPFFSILKTIKTRIISGFTTWSLVQTHGWVKSWLTYDFPMRVGRKIGYLQWLNYIFPMKRLHFLGYSQFSDISISWLLDKSVYCCLNKNHKYPIGWSWHLAFHQLFGFSTILLVKYIPTIIGGLYLMMGKSMGYIYIYIYIYIYMNFLI